MAAISGTPNVIKGSPDLWHLWHKVQGAPWLWPSWSLAH